MLKVKTMSSQIQEEMLELLSFIPDAKRVRGFQFSGVITCAHMGFLVMQLLSGYPCLIQVTLAYSPVTNPS